MRIWIECYTCGGDGIVEHDCFEDCCCCLEPNDDICTECDGEGGHWRELPADFPATELRFS
jgi:hypothetical protein